MLSTSEIILEYVCPAAGTVTSTLMFSAPYLDALKATSETGQMGDLNPTCWAFMLGNCFGWVCYSMFIRNFFLFFANAPGLILSVWLNIVAVKLRYENHKTSAIRKSIIGAFREESSTRASIVDYPSEPIGSMPSPSSESLCPGPDKSDPDGVSPVSQISDYARIVWEVTSQHQPIPAPHEILVIGIVTYWLIVMSTVAFGDKSFSRDVQKTIVGVAVNLNLVFFYGAPLSTIELVLRKRSSASIHIPTMITNTANGIFWAAFGVAVLDLFVAVPNALGAVLGVIQMVLCLLVPRKNESQSSECLCSVPSTNEKAECSQHEEHEEEKLEQEEAP